MLKGEVLIFLSIQNIGGYLVFLFDISSSGKVLEFQRFSIYLFFIDFGEVFY